MARCHTFVGDYDTAESLFSQALQTQAKFIAIIGAPHPPQRCDSEVSGREPTGRVRAGRASRRWLIAVAIATPIATGATRRASM